MAFFRSWKTMVSAAELVIWVEITRCKISLFVVFFYPNSFFYRILACRTLFHLFGSLPSTIIWHLNATWIATFCLPESYSFVVPSLHKGFSRFLSLSVTILAALFPFFLTFKGKKKKTDFAASFADNHAFHLHTVNILSFLLAYLYYLLLNLKQTWKIGINVNSKVIILKFLTR